MSRNTISADIYVGQEASQAQANETSPKQPIATRRAQQTDKVLDTLAFIINQAGCGIDHKLEAARIYSDILKVRVL